MEWNHPLILMQSDIDCIATDIFESKRRLEYHKINLQLAFNTTDLYKELKDTYDEIKIEFIDEEQLHLKCIKGSATYTVIYDSQRIADKLAVTVS